MEIAGIDAETIVTQLMQLEERPLLALEARQDDARTALNSISKIRTQVEAFRLAASKLADVGGFGRYQASASLSDVVTASVTGSAAPGSLTFTVSQLAQSHGLRSVNTVASDSIAVTSDSFIAVAAGTASLGFDSVRAGAALGEGSVALSITQASDAANLAGTSALAASTVVDGSNNTIEVTVNGAARTVTIASGTYDEAGLAVAVQNAFDSSGGGVDASLSADGTLALSTTREGSAADLQVTGGTALASLRLGVDASAHVGTDAVIDVDGTITTVTQLEAGQTVSVDTGDGLLDINLSGGLRVGNKTVAVVSTGDGSLSDVAAAVNASNAGVSAAAVQVGDGAWRLQLSARATGEDGQIAIDDAVFSDIGGLIESSSAQNARITIGSGPGAYDVEASGNTFSNVMSGVTLTARSVSAGPVTVDVTRDDNSIASDAAAMVSAINTVLAEIKVQTRFDPATGASGALAGNSTVRRLADQLRAALGGQVAGLGSSLPSTAGIELTREGSFSFDQAKFISALQADPVAIERLFGRGGTDSGDVVFAGAIAETTHGSYDVDVTTAATRATSALLFDGGSVASSRIGVRVGSVTATLDVAAGQSTAQIVAALNGALTESGLDVVAEVDGTGLRVRAEEWGSVGDFELNLDVNGAGAWNAQTGADVVGTIDGVAAVGAGRLLTMSPLADTPAAGLSVEVAAGVSGALGMVDYVPGIAARVVEITTALTDDDTGSLTSAKEATDRRITAFADQITRLEDRLLIRETNLRRQWSSMQTLLSGLQNQGSWLSGQLASLSNNWGGSS